MILTMPVSALLSKIKELAMPLPGSPAGPAPPDPDGTDPRLDPAPHEERDPFLTPMLRSAVLGRGLRPYSLWLLSVGLPTLVLFARLWHNETAPAWAAWTFAATFAAWTIPHETLGQAIVDFGRVRAVVVELAPVLVSVSRSLPRLVLAAYPVFPQLLPHVGALAEHLPLLLPHAEALIRILPKLSSRIDDLLPIAIKVGPKFKDFTPETFAKLELILDDVIEKLDVIAPHIDSLLLHDGVLTDGIKVAPRMLKHIEVVAPHLAALEKHLQWLLPFAEVEGVEEMLPLLDRIAPRIHELEPFAEAILAHWDQISVLLPALKEGDNIDLLLDVVPQTIDHLDPLLYWFGGVLPYASRMGVLRSSALLSAAGPIAKLLPPVPRRKSRPRPRPGAGVAELARGETGNEWWRFASLDHVVAVPRAKFVNGVAFFVLEVDGRYAGEFRYRHARELHDAVQHVLPADAAPFPPRLAPWEDHSAGSPALERRRAALERFMVRAMADPRVVREPAFEFFVKVRRKWAEELPALLSPLIAAGGAA